MREVKSKNMPGRKIVFENNKYYHIFNRGTDKRAVFLDEKDYARFLISLKEFNEYNSIESIYRINQLRKAKKTSEVYDLKNRRPRRSSIVEIICYCLNPNHYHLLLRQLKKGGISEFMGKLGNGYTKYFNARNNRSGSLFQGRFKAVEIQSDYQLWQTSCYINGNAEIHGISKSERWPWSSCMDYLNLRNDKLCAKDLVLNDFKDLEEYKDLLSKVIKYSKERKEEIKQIALE